MRNTSLPPETPVRKDDGSGAGCGAGAGPAAAGAPPSKFPTGAGAGAGAAGTGSGVTPPLPREPTAAAYNIPSAPSARAVISFFDDWYSTKPRPPEPGTR